MKQRMTFGALVAVALSGACGENEKATAYIRSVLEEVGAGVPDSTAGGDSASVASAADAGGAAQPVLQLPNGDTLHIRPVVVALYRERQYEPAWTDDDEILPRGLEMLKALAAASSEGLDPERYHFSTARDMARLLEEDAVEDRELEYLGNLDLLLTEGFARFAQDLEIGTMDPRAGDREWRIPRETVADRSLIERVLAGEDPKAVLASVRPRAPHYDRMVNVLARYRQVEESGGWGTVPGGETLENGDRDPRVAALRSRLSAGDDPEETRLAKRGAGDPQLFDAQLAEALQHFQQRHGLDPDGALGGNTVEALNVPLEDRVAAIRINLDRWRWLPNELGEMFILVNVAGFELELVKEDSAIESMNVVVGATANRTPLFQDTLEYMVVNPYWNVPESIAQEEILPMAQRDPTYLARNNYEVVRDGGATRIRQRPGRANALGNVKFVFPNSMNIYLHDTPADHLFSQTSRAFSHGCIRVERPDDLARTLLAALTDRDPSDYDRLRRAEGEQWIKFDRQIPVYIVYFTAWANQDGTARFHDDIYQRDETLGPEAERKLAPVRPRPIAMTRD
ncbi:MAG TPA: L,D-transpeptidase family protein [Longimicrobiales bacterium]|nr:L,D-transpeptidase family protein [Longimicrobiales bacterium]